MPVKEKLLPLPYHTERPIVQYSNLNRKIVCHCSRYFLRVHLKASVTGEIKYELIRIGCLRTQCSRQAKTHSPESSRCKACPRLVKLKKLCNPHLMLTYIRSHYCISACKLIN